MLGMLRLHRLAMQAGKQAPPLASHARLEKGTKCIASACASELPLYTSPISSLRLSLCVFIVASLYSPTLSYPPYVSPSL